MRVIATVGDFVPNDMRRYNRCCHTYKHIYVEDDDYITEAKEMLKRLFFRPDAIEVVETEAPNLYCFKAMTYYEKAHFIQEGSVDDF